MNTFPIQEDVSLDLQAQLLKYGPVGEGIEYYVSSKNVHDLTLKIWIQINESLKDPTKSMLTVLRLDNRLSELDRQSKDRRSATDLLWENIQGWNEDLFIRFKDGFRISIPRQPDSPLYQREIRYRAPQSDQGKLAKRTEKKIPKIIHQILGDTSEKIPVIVEKLHSLLKIKNPFWKMMTVNLDEIGPLIRNLEGEKCLRAFQTIQPIAYKADLYRLVVLYHYGGVYLDSKMIPLRTMDELLPAEGCFLAFDTNFKNIQGAVLGFPKGDPFLRDAIDQIIDNVNKRYYGKGFLCPTGPALLEKVWEREEYMKSPSYKKLAHLKGGILRSTKDDSKLFLFHNAEYRRVGFSSSRCHYAAQYKRRTIYGERLCRG